MRRRLPARLGSFVLEGARPLLRHARRSAFGRYTSGTIVVVVHRLLPWRGRAGRTIDAACSRIPFHPAFRAASVGALVDLFFELVDAWEVERFVEAGAKEASASRRAAKLPAVQRTVAFEANPFTHRRFVKRLRRTPVEYHHLALDAVGGTTSFFVRRNDDGSPKADGQGSLLRRADYRPGHQEVTVDSTSLDEFFADDVDASTAMWVDVEGAIGKVMRGASAVLGSTEAVLVEVEDRAVWSDDQWLASDVTAFLADFDLVPVARDVQSAIQYNLLFVPRSRSGDRQLEAALRRWRRRIRRGDDRPGDH